MEDAWRRPVKCIKVQRNPKENENLEGNYPKRQQSSKDAHMARQSKEGQLRRGSKRGNGTIRQNNKETMQRQECGGSKDKKQRADWWRYYVLQLLAKTLSSADKYNRGADGSSSKRRQGVENKTRKQKQLCNNREEPKTVVVWTLTKIHSVSNVHKDYVSYQCVTTHLCLCLAKKKCNTFEVKYAIGFFDDDHRTEICSWPGPLRGIPPPFPLHVILPLF